MATHFVGTVYRALLRDFDAERYHLGEFCVGFGQDTDEVERRFVSGRTERAHLVVFADGISSTGRGGCSPTSSAATRATWAGAAPSARTRCPAGPTPYSTTPSTTTSK